MYFNNIFGFKKNNPLISLNLHFNLFLTIFWVYLRKKFDVEDLKVSVQELLYIVILWITLKCEICMEIRNTHWKGKIGKNAEQKDVCNSII
jgi:hypothetical protein